MGRPQKLRQHEVLDHIESGDPGEPFTVREIADAFDVDKKTAQRRLDELVEAGFLKKKYHTENQVTFWLPPR